MKDFFDAVFFDMDGLMVDSEPEWLLSEIDVTAPFGYSWQEADQIACLGGPLTKVGQYMFDKCGQKELVQQLQAHGIKTGLVSASPRNIVDAVLDNLGHELFPFSISSDDVQHTKPNPECYLKAAAISGSDISNCLIFEDSLTGMKAAMASGAYLIAVPHLVLIDESERVRVIQSLQQMSFTKLQGLKADFTILI